MFKRILLAVDGSEHSIRSARYAIELANKFEGTTDIIYVVDGKTAKEDVLHSTNKLEIEKKREEKLKPILDMLDKSGMDYNTNVLHGDPGPEIVEFANEKSYDCVVIGSRGLNDLQSFILGSVSHKVAKRVNCPVLIVK
ncbi:universal stress protein [Agaribacter marinus]|uniref:Universal stress protein n=1 Tax=Virgibacillus salarius TaxID=447199 RepID=A0A941DYS2_9BACI|nr:universal stress protein [Virgibacillus salarius]MBR7798082.1 universal stress protein [Virgibacillus salarius]NAZ10790.1 universal stress protein [Agaribacter marinus]